MKATAQATAQASTGRGGGEGEMKVSNLTHVKNTIKKRAKTIFRPKVKPTLGAPNS